MVTGEIDYNLCCMKDDLIEYHILRNGMAVPKWVDEGGGYVVMPNETYVAWDQVQNNWWGLTDGDVFLRSQKTGRVKPYRGSDFLAYYTIINHKYACTDEQVIYWKNIKNKPGRIMVKNQRNQNRSMNVDEFIDVYKFRGGF